MKIKKWGKRVMIVFGIFLSVLIVVMVIGSILQRTYYANKFDSIQPYGQLVDVKDGKMHVLSMGQGEQTIVLLPGMGVGLPSADFGPLMRKLSESYKVVIVEYFGVGFSTRTSSPRTTENYVEEIRTVLEKSGFNAPYILMPHSISSVYSEYYASKYPAEVEAIVSLDGTSTAYYEEAPAIMKYVLPIAKFQQSTGMMSILANITTNKDKLTSLGYTNKEVGDMISYGGFSMNDNVLDQISSSADYIKDVLELEFPEAIPYFKVISKSTYETPNKQLKISPQEYQHQHLDKIGNNARYEILDGNHFIYANNSDEIFRIVNELTSK